MLKNDFVFIINPASGNGKAKEYFKIIENIFSINKVEMKYAFSDYPKHVLSIVPAFIKNGYRKFIAVGGDGTLNEILNSIIKTDFENSNEYTLGIIPVGTGNDWAKTMEIKANNPKQAADVLLKNNVIKHDIGLIKNVTTNEKNYFLNIAGFGLDGIICKKLHDKRKENKKRIGKLWYYYAILRNFLNYKALTINLKFDELNFQKRITFVAIAICKYYGNGFMPAKTADPTDGQFKLTTVDEVSTFGLLNKLRNLFKGKIDHYKEVEKFNTQSIQATSKQNVYIQADGEFFGVLPANFSILKNKINVITNAPHF